MIAVPWFKFPWTTATADLAHALIVRAVDGDAEARGQLDAVKAQADAGNALGKEAWRHLNAVAKLVAAGEPPPSVILQLRGVAVGQWPGALPSLPWGYQSIWNYGFDPFVFEELQADAELGLVSSFGGMSFNPPSWPRAVGEPLPGEIEYGYEVGAPPPGLNFGMGPLPGGVPLLPFGFGPWNYGSGDDGAEYFRSGPGMSEDIELADRYIG